MSAAPAQALPKDNPPPPQRDNPPRKESPPQQETGLLSGHLIAYGDLLAAILHSWQKTMGQRIMGAVVALCGLSTGVMLLTFGAIAAAWPTDYRWLVLFGIAALYLLAGAIGVWLLMRKPPVPAPASVLFNEVRKDVELLSAAWRERGNGR